MADIFDTHTIDERLKAHQCLKCGLDGMELDPRTGFPFHYCGPCEVIVERERLAEQRKSVRSSRDRKRHKEEGLANLDRLTGGASQS